MSTEEIADCHRTCHLDAPGEAIPSSLAPAPHFGGGHNQRDSNRDACQQHHAHSLRAPLDTWLPRPRRHPRRTPLKTHGVAVADVAAPIPHPPKCGFRTFSYRAGVANSGLLFGSIGGSLEACDSLLESPSPLRTVGAYWWYSLSLLQPRNVSTCSAQARSRHPLGLRQKPFSYRHHGGIALG